MVLVPWWSPAVKYTAEHKKKIIALFKLLATDQTKPSLVSQKYS